VSGIRVPAFCHQHQHTHTNSIRWFVGSFVRPFVVAVLSQFVVVDTIVIVVAVAVFVVVVTITYITISQQLSAQQQQHSRWRLL